MIDETEIVSLRDKVEVLEQRVAKMEDAIMIAANIGIIASTAAMAETTEARVETLRYITQALIKMNTLLGKTDFPDV